METIERSHSYKRLSYTSFAVSSEFTGTASSSVDNKLEMEGKNDQPKELTGLKKDHKINAIYDRNEPRNNQSQTRVSKMMS